MEHGQKREKKTRMVITVRACDCQGYVVKPGIAMMGWIRRPHLSRVEQQQNTSTNDYNTQSITIKGKEMSNSVLYLN